MIPISCTRCRRVIPPDAYNLGRPAPCPACRQLVQVEAYPAILAGPAVGWRSETILTDGQASCFHHARKKAAVACDRCGRFLCSLCATELGQRLLCLDCYKQELSGESVRADGPSASRQFTRYDNMALILSVLPICGLTALAALFLAIGFWNKRTSVLPQSHVRGALAILLSLGQLVGWAFFYAASGGRLL
jgi:hypothetical protein